MSANSHKRTSETPKILLLELSQEHLDLLRRELVLKERVATFRDIEGKRVRPTTDAAQAITPFPIEFADQAKQVPIRMPALFCSHRRG